MDWSLILVLFLIGFIGSFISGMVGIGGAIVNFPMLLYIPPLLGFTAFTAHQVSGISAVQVFFATIGGVLIYRKSGYLNKTVILYMGISVLFGSFIGSYGSHLLPEHSINLVYGILAIAAVILMFIPKKGIDDFRMEQLQINKWLAAVLAFIVGISAGIVGAGGAFLLVPIMLTILKIPTRVTIASSIAVTLISSIGVTVGKVFTGQVSYLPAIVVVIASLIASPLGAKMGKKMNTKILQGILAMLIGATALKVWIDIIHSYF
ncbi:sulfite exporter TauE/SafE family protein [Neobacillus ginsengisoli]|uniref:Probable membrane transporter protein n=1 Tax=Neobacillus ginsengisoli TaxID=904295 RepID=A0ABT9XR01_9BACI|nr:sulfite exporter TauE/SafE family protein [Neobacillus ginsengisoli]MDQ0197987.1 putative membrane protein YfcA [Neobacillus ginsengisoli]